MDKKYKKESLNYGVLTKELSMRGPEKLYLLWGPEDYLIADFIDRLRSACVGEGTGEFDVKRLDGPMPDAADVEEALNAMPFFGGRVFVELRGFDVNKCRDERVTALFADIPEWCTVVIILPEGGTPDGRLAFVKQLKKDGKAVEFTAQNEDVLYRWIARRFQARGKRIDKNAMDRLTMLSGELMNQLIPEIEKICASTAVEQITVRDVENLAHHIPEAVAFDMTECIAQGDYDGAAAFLAELLAGDAEPVEIIGTIGWQIRRLYAAKVILENDGKVAQIRDLLDISRDYTARKLAETAQRLSLQELSNDVRHVAEYSMKFREQGSVITDTEALKELLIRLAMENRHAVH